MLVVPSLAIPVLVLRYIIRGLGVGRGETRGDPRRSALTLVAYGPQDGVSSGSFGEPTAAVTPGRSANSFHYGGLALDLATTSEMRDPRVDPFIVTVEGDLWRVWARTDGGEERRLDAVVWRDGATRTETVEAYVIDRTALAASHGFRRISRPVGLPRQLPLRRVVALPVRESPRAWITQFGIELVSLQRYTQAHP